MMAKMKEYLQSPMVLSSSSYYGRLYIKYQTVVLWFSWNSCVHLLLWLERWLNWIHSFNLQVVYQWQFTWLSLILDLGQMNLKSMLFAQNVWLYMKLTNALPRNQMDMLFQVGVHISVFPIILKKAKEDSVEHSLWKGWGQKVDHSFFTPRGYIVLGSWLIP